MKYLEEMLDLASQQFKEMVERGKFRSYDEIHAAYELIDIVKDIYCIWNYEDGQGDYSETGYMYPNEESYARSRYSKRGRDDSRRYGRYSMNDAIADYTDELKKIMYETTDEDTKHKIKSLIQHTERM